MKHLIKWSEAHPKIVFFALTLIVIWSCLYLSQIKIDASSKIFMSANDPDLRVYDETVNEFGSDLITVVYIQDSNLFSPSKLNSIADLTFEFEEIDGVVRVESLATVSDIRNEEGMLYTGPLMDWAPETDEESLQLKQYALENPILRSNLLSQNAQATAINLYLRTGDPDENFLLHMHDAVQKVIDSHENQFDALFQIGAAYKFKIYKDTINSDFTHIFPLACLFLIISMMAMMRTWTAALIPLLTSFISILITFGFMGALHIPVTLLTFIVPCLLLVVGSTEDMHLIAEFGEGLRLTGDRKQAIHHMADKTGTAISLTAVTTVIGFFAISLNDMTLLRQFGYTAAFGLFVNFIVTVLLVPLLLKTLPYQKQITKGSSPFKALLNLFASALTQFTHKYKWLIFALSLFICFLGCYWWTTVRIDNDTREYFRPGHPFLERVETLEQGLSGANTFWVRIQGEANDFRSPKNLEYVDALQEAINKQEWVDKTVSFVDFLKLIHREINEGNTDFYKVPDKTQSVNEYCLFLSRDEISRYVSSDYSSVSILVRHSNYSSRGLKAGVDQLTSEAQRLVPVRFTIDFTGEDILINHAADAIAGGQIKGLMVISATVLIVMMLLFMSIKTGIYSMLPNLIPVGVAFWLMKIFDIPLNTGTCLVAAISVGIAVDDTIHIMSRFQSCLRRYQNETEALYATLQSELLPVLTTSISLSIGFALLAMSQFVPIAQFAFLSACVLITALLTDLLVTPVVLMLTQSINIWDLFELHIKKESLKQSPLLRDFTRWQMKKLVLIARMRDASAGEFIVNKGEVGNAMFLILDGTATAILPTQEDRAEITLAQFGPGDVFGEIAVISQCERTASIKAETPLRYIEFDHKGLERIRKYYPYLSSKLMFNLAGILGNRLSDANKVISNR